MKKIFKFIFVFIFLINFIAFTKAEEQNYKILKLVNDNVITNYDLEQRLRLFSFLNKIPLNEDNMKPYADEMLKLMIDEKLQREQIKKYKVQVQSIEIDDYIIEVFLASEQNIDDLKKSLASNDIDINFLKESLEIQLGWNKLIGKLFYRTSEINETDFDEVRKKFPTLSEESIKSSLLQKQIALRAEKLLRDLRLEANIENR
tara:strand:+ start:2493 stop:3101 length:609 start_codon:yes stop_codon:yes gene_type:complete